MRSAVCCCSRVQRVEQPTLLFTAQSHLHLQFEQQLTNKIVRRDPEFVLFLKGNLRCLPYAPHNRPLAVLDGFSSGEACIRLII